MRPALALWLTAGLFLFPPGAFAEYQAKGRRDPFIPLLTESGQRIYPPGYDEEVPTGLSGLRLQGIVFDPKADSYAVVNGEIVRLEEEVEGFKVVRIDAVSITVAAEGESHQLFLRNPEERKETEAQGPGGGQPTEEVGVP